MALVSLTQQVLRCLAAHGPATAAEIQRKLDCPGPQVNTAITNVRRRGLVKAELPKGRTRGAVMSLTDAGKELADKPASIVSPTRAAKNVRLGASSARRRGADADDRDHVDSGLRRPCVAVTPRRDGDLLPEPRFAFDDQRSVAIAANGQTVVLDKDAALRLYEFLDRMEPLLREDEAA